MSGFLASRKLAQARNAASDSHNAAKAAIEAAQKGDAILAASYAAKAAQAAQTAREMAHGATSGIANASFEAQDFARRAHAEADKALEYAKEAETAIKAMVLN